MVTALLFSGGLDSTAVLFWKRPKIAISINYGQAAWLGELAAAKSITRELGIDHDILTVDCSQLGLGDMSRNIVGEPSGAQNFPADWWPFRNQLLLTIAASRGIALGAQKIITGTVKSDARFVDGTTAFYEALNNAISIQEGAITIDAPAIYFSATELLRESGIPISIAAWSHSCHRAEIACGNCKGCKKRAEIMREYWGIE